MTAARNRLVLLIGSRPVLIPDRAWTMACTAAVAEHAMGQKRCWIVQCVDRVKWGQRIMVAACFVLPTDVASACIAKKSNNEWY